MSIRFARPAAALVTALPVIPLCRVAEGIESPLPRLALITALCAYVVAWGYATFAPFRGRAKGSSAPARVARFLLAVATALPVPLLGGAMADAENPLLRFVLAVAFGVYAVWWGYEFSGARRSDGERRKAGRRA